MPRFHTHCARVACLFALLICSAASAQSVIADFESGKDGWNFGLGSEWPGATGSAQIVNDAHSGRSALQITGDFTGGGRYVHITRNLSPTLEPGPIELWVKSTTLDYIMLRLVDESGQTFQPQLKLAKQPGWQKLTLAKLNAGQHWGAPGSTNDGQWHGKLTLISILFEKQSISAGATKAVLLLDDIKLTNGQSTTQTAPTESKTPATTNTNTSGGSTASLNEGFENGEGGWKFSPGGEFKGAKGGMEVTDQQFHAGSHAMKLSADFSGGGRYVQVYLPLDAPIDATGVSFFVKPHDCTYILVRTEDSTGQTFQHNIKVQPNDNWQEIKLPRLTAGTKWGGAKDGQWHGPLTKLAIMLEKQSIPNGGTSAWMHIDDIQITGSGGETQSNLLRLPMPLGDFTDGLAGWWPLSASNVDVKLTRDAQTGCAAPGALQASVTFTSGGWFTLMHQMDQEFDIGSLKFQVKATNVKAINVWILTRTGQSISRQIRIAQPDQWQLVELSDLPAGTQPLARNDGKLFGAAAAIRISFDSAQLIDSANHTATMWLDDAEATAMGEGVLYVPGAAMRSGDQLIGRIQTLRETPVYWGADDKPDAVKVLFINESDKPVKIPAVRLLDHTLHEIATLYTGGDLLAPGATFDKQLALNLTQFGHYTVATQIAGKPLDMQLAWFAAEGKPDPDGPFGIHQHLSQGPWGRGQYLGGGTAVIDLTRKLGAGWIREDIRGEFDRNDQLTRTDRQGYFGWADAASSAGLSMIGTYFDFLNNGKPPSDDASRARYAKRFAQLVRHYHDVVHVFEVWNEPNISPGWRGTPSPDDYAAMIKAAYPAIKQADPKVTVLGVTSAGTDFTYIEKVLADGATPFMDALSLHPYHAVAPELGNSNPDAPPVWMGVGSHIDFTQRIELAGQILARHGGAGKSIWATEMGWGDKDPSLEWLHTCHLVRQYLLGMAIPQLRMMVAYNFQDQGFNEDESSGMTFGFFRANGAPEAHAVAYNTMTRLLYKHRFAERIDLGEGVYAFRFTRTPGTPNTGDVFAIWSVDQGLTASFATKSPTVTAVDLMGNPRKISPIDGRVTLAATGEPVFILDAGEITKAAPLLTASSVEQATSEDRITVDMHRTSPMAAGAITGQCGAGWKVADTGQDSVTFTTRPDMTNGRYVLTVHDGQMSAAVSVNLRNAIQLATTCDATGTLTITASNPFPNPRKVQLRPIAADSDVKLDAATLDIPGHGQSTFTLQPPTRTSGGGGWTTLPVTINAALPDNQIGYIEFPAHGERVITGVTPWYNITPVIDGKLNDWQSLAPCILDKPWQAVPVGRFATANWQGVNDLSAQFRVGSDTTAMYLAVTVHDDRHVADFPTDQMWKGDSVQCAFLIGETRYEFTMAVDGQGIVHVRQDSPVRQPLNDIAARGSLDGSDYTLEVALPWKVIGLSDATPPRHFALLVNDNDQPNNSAQAGRKGFLEWFGGIGGDKKDPSLYGPVAPQN